MDWSVTQVTRTHKDLARAQLGSSGSGNHFAEFGMLTLEKDDEQLGLKAGKYVALLTHSGSRGTGSAVCQVYSGIAQANCRRSTRTSGGWRGSTSIARQARNTGRR